MDFSAKAVSLSDSVQAVFLRGELDICSSEAAMHAVADHDSPVTRVVVDLGQLSFIDSYGYRALGLAKALLEARGIACVFRRPRGIVRLVFDLLREIECLETARRL